MRTDAHPASLRTRLTWLIIAVMVAVLIPLGWISYRRELREMNELLDGRLAQAGRTLGTLIAHGELPQRDAELPGIKQDGETRHHGVVVSVHPRNYEPEVGFQAYDPSGELIAATSNLSDLPPPSADERGFRDIRHEGRLWRTFTLQNRANLVIRIGERSDNRQDIARGLVIEHTLPLLIGLPLLALLVSLAVKRGLRPVAVLTEMLDRRTPGSRKPMPANVAPQEIKPLIVALNQQLERLEDALEREHRFATDVAHELRTPLAATMIHLESAMISDDPTEVEFTVRNAQQSMARLGRRVEQILAMARLEAGAASQQRTALDLARIATEVIEELAPMIVEKDITASLSNDDEPVVVRGHEVALTAMFRNLIENALRYTEAGGQVEVAIHRDGTMAIIDIYDNGPGIPEGRRQAVFQRFHREEESATRGYGLGLNIVQRAIELHEASVELLESPLGRGLLVRIRMVSEAA
ncbi:sensor histidine kinase [Dyella jiangningensis]|uniref:histidine kinase n=1 Tax=Dyella jiangningensis TaxID=1379159 RepID=A0A328P8V5_9GAMM|nr:ATP-binding protein [Dyella jiangningensis]RAO77753.1 two-component sensor histidine kinase [Dyella jiangningensis]